MSQEYKAVMKLWQRVLIQAFIDAMNQSDKIQDERDRRDALHFLTTPRAELAGLCLICGYQMRDVIRVASNLATSNQLTIRQALKQLQGRQ